MQPVIFDRTILAKGVLLQAAHHDLPDNPMV
jgi:hypothetical protein